MQPEPTALKRTHDAPVALVVHQHQVKEKGQEQKVGKDVHQQAGREAERAVQAHPGDEGKRYAGAHVGHQQAQEEVVLRVVKLAVAGDGQDYEQVDQDDSTGDGQRDGVDQLGLHIAPRDVSHHRSHHCHFPQQTSILRSA